MKTTLLKNVFLEGKQSDILIEGNKFAAICDAESSLTAQDVIQAEGLAILPTFYNTHTHAAMNLLKGYADDMPLFKWLSEYIWPFEEKMTPKDMHEGSELAVEEMISSGTVLFNDMYFNIEETIDVVAKAGLRAEIGITVMENHSLAQTEEKKRFIQEFKDPTGGRIHLVMAPHAIYTVGAEKYKKTAEFARDNGLRIHTHVSETRSEYDDCVKKHGMSPVKYLDSLGILGPDVIAAHCVHISREDADILAERGVTISHCPCSNMKLGSGRFPYEIVKAAGCKVALGTDGASSNNNLDMREEMKFAALLAKLEGDPELLPAPEILSWATVNGAEAFGLKAGKIEEGYLADFLLVDLSNIRLRPNYNLISNWVYSADTSCIRSVFCDGRKI